MGVEPGLAVVDQQAVAAAEHQAKRGIGTLPQQPRLAGESLVAGGKIAQAKEVVIVQTLGVQLADPVPGLLTADAATVKLGIGQGGPVTDTALACQRKQATGVAAIAGQVELVAQQQPAALFGQGVVARCVAGQARRRGSARTAAS